MVIDKQGAAYMLAVAAAIGAIPRSYLTSVCPDCGRLQFHLDNDEHIVVDVSHLPNPRHDVAIVITCAGNWAVNPALVGLTVPDWHPEPKWPQGEEDV